MDENKSIPEETQNTATQVATDEGGNEPLPESSEKSTAENKNQNKDADTQSPEDTDASSQELTDESKEDLAKWAESQGIDFENPTPEAMQKMAQRVRDTQSKMHQATAKSAELEGGIGEVIDNAASIGQVDANEARMLKMEQQLKVTQFYANNPEAREHDGKMSELVRQKPWLANDLNDLYRLARLESSAGGIDKITENARKNERELLNQKQRAGVSRPSASAKSVKTEDEDPIMAGLKSND